MRKLLAMAVAALWIVSLPAATTAQAESTTVVKRASQKAVRCESNRRAVPYYRTKTWERQAMRHAGLADRTPLIRGRSCHWVDYAVTEWKARSAAARNAYEEWWKSVGQTIRRLDSILAGHRMAGTGVYLERSGRRHGVSPFFMVATAATESSYGDAACGPGGFNAWGLGNCGSAWTVPAFSSWEEAIEYYAEFLTRWEGHTSPYSFRGYAACDACWGRKVSGYMESFGVPTLTRYP